MITITPGDNIKEAMTMKEKTLYMWHTIITTGLYLALFVLATSHPESCNSENQRRETRNKLLKKKYVMELDSIDQFYINQVVNGIEDEQRKKLVKDSLYEECYRSMNLRF